MHELKIQFINSTICDNITIGNDIIVGAGVTVLENLPNELKKYTKLKFLIITGKKNIGNQ